MTDHEAELEKLCERLERRFADFRRNREKGPDPEPINPDGPEAARRLREMAARLAAAEEAAEDFERLWSIRVKEADAIAAAPPKEAEPWRPIEDYAGTGPVMVSTAPESSKYLFSEPVSAFRDAAGVWRCLGSIGGMAELARKPTHFRTLPSKPDLVPIEKATSGETL